MSKQWLHIGITGGIGSGKSFICKIFESLAYRVYYADAAARRIMNSDPELVASVTQLFGEEAYTKDGQLNRPYIGGIVFNEPQKLAALNALVHPAVGRDYFRWYAETPESYPHNFVLKEAAIMYESGSHLATDGIITVYAPKQLRLERVLSREDISREAVLARMDKQWPESEKLRRADFCIFNDGERHLLPQILEAIQKFS